jgi:hypothetical protein
MTGKQDGKNTMEMALRDFLLKNKTITAMLPGFDGLFTTYSSNLLKIQVIRGQQEIDKSGIKDNKGNLRMDLVSKAYDVARKTEVYALMNNNAILAKEIHYSETNLTKTSDSKLKAKAQLIYDRAFANAAVLVPYGISAAALTALKTAIDVFNTAIPSTRIGITEKKAATDQLAVYFKQNDDILEKFDLLVELVRKEQPAFYNSYKDNRKIVHSGTNTLAYTAYINDAINDEGIKGVKATFEGQDIPSRAASSKPMKPLVKYTAEKGIFKIRNMAEGTYTVTLEKPGYKTVTITTTAVSGEMTILNIKLERA